VILVDKTKDDEPSLVRSSSDRPRRTTRRRRFIQKLERGLTSIGERHLGAAREALGTYVEARDRSATSKTDGAYKDFSKNVRKAYRHYLNEKADLRADVIDFVDDLIRSRRDDDDDDDDDDEDEDED
jgi:hypothetical protein